MKKLFAISFFLITFFPGNMLAQKIWTLEECIHSALDNNIQIKQQQLSTLVSKLQYDQSIASFFPSINGNATHVYSSGQTIDVFTNQFVDGLVQSNNFSASANLVLFNGLQQLNSFKQKHLDFLASKYDLEKIKNDISLTIAISYLQILYNTELLEIAKKQVELTKTQVARTKTLYDVGSVAKGTLLGIESQLASDELSLVNAQNSLDLSYLTLAQLLDLQSTQGFDIVKPSLSLPDANSLMQQVDEIYGKAVSIQPDIKSAELKVQSARKGLSISRGMMSPSLSLMGSVGTGFSEASSSVSVLQNGFSTIGFTESGELVYAPAFEYQYGKIKFWDQIDKNVNNSFGLYLNIPIFNKWQTNTMIGTSKISLKNAELVLQNTKNQLFKTIQQAYADARAALNRYNASTKSVEAMTESFGYVQQKFDVGLINSIDYNDAKNNLLKAKSELLQAKYDYVFRLKVLDFYQGKPITL